MRAAVCFPDVNSRDRNSRVKKLPVHPAFRLIGILVQRWSVKHPRFSNCIFPYCLRLHQECVSAAQEERLTIEQDLAAFGQCCLLCI